MTDDQTRAVYDARAQAYADRFHSEKAGRHLTDFLALVPAGGNVLDWGCGPGMHAAQMIAAGFRVRGEDASAEMVALARDTNRIDAHQRAFDDLAAVSAFDGIWANFSLLHAPRDRMDRHLGAAAAALRPGGAFHIGLKTGTGARRDRLGRFYTFYSPKDLRARLAAAGLAVLAEDFGEEAGFAGPVEPWMVMLARKDG